MEVTVNEVDPVRGRVIVSAPGIKGGAAWKGGAVGPGSTVDVEVDVTSEVPWGQVVFGPLNTRYAQDTVELVGTIRDVDDLNVLTLELAGGGIVLIDMAGAGPGLLPSASVAIRSCDVALYPTGM